MTTPNRSIVGVLLLGFVVCGNPAPEGEAIAAPAPTQPDSADELRAVLIDATGKKAGEVAVRAGSMGLLLQVRATGLSAGFHGVHLHAVGDCSDPGDFKRSGGHIEHANDTHGYLHDGGVHPGDLPNLYAHIDGVARADFFATELELGDLQDSDGAALIIHAEPDNYWTRPVGGAGPRIACAAFSERE